MRCPSLTEISGSNVDDRGLQALSTIQKSTLTSVCFTDSNISDVGVLRLCKGCPNIKTLSLAIRSSTNVFNLTDDSVRSIAQYCPDIEKLSLEGWEDLADNSMTALVTLTSLKELNLSRCDDLTSAGVQSLLRSIGANIEVLVLSDEDVYGCCDFCDDALLRCIGECCPNLRDLVVKVNIIFPVLSASFEAIIRRCPLLNTVSLGSWILSSDVIMVQIADCCPHLTALSLQWGKYTDAGVAAVVSKCIKLRCLRLCEFSNLRNESLTSIATHCSNLQELGLSSNCNFTDRYMSMLFKSCTQLESITLSSIPLITDRSIQALTQSCSRIKYLYISNNKRLTDRSFAYLIMLHELESLHIVQCLTLTDHTLGSLARHCTKLKSITLHTCPLVTKRGLISLIEHGKRLKSITILTCNALLTTEVNGTLHKRLSSPHRLRIDLGTMGSFVL